MLAMAACELPPLPRFTTIDAPDMAPAEDTSELVVVCPPLSRLCVGDAVRVCSADGTDFEIEACQEGQTCDGGACRAIANTCEGEQRFALSATELTFDASRDLKTQTKQITLRNCGTSALIVRAANVRGPERPDGTPVFELVGLFAQTSIPPAGALDIKVSYRPTAGLAHVTGRLELSLIANELTNVEVALRSKALCAAATPFVDLGIQPVETDVVATGRVQNCGTEPFEVVGWEGPVTYAVTFDEELPHDLGPGAELSYTLKTSAAVPALFDGELTVATNDPLLEPVTQVRGLAVHPGCAEVVLAEPQILANNQIRPVEAGALVRVRFPDATNQALHWLDLVEQPAFAFERLARGADGWTIRPRVVGTYRAALRGYHFATGTPSCATDEVRFEVLPSAGLHVELVWQSASDGIPEDLGFGHAANLDLHVLSTPDGRGVWNDPGSDCFPGVVGPCGAGGGSISVSQGGLPEFVRFREPGELMYEVGVYVSNPFNFQGLEARVRVYHEQVLVAELGSSSLQNANDFWLVGRWDAATETWASIDRVFAGFPR